MKHLSAESALYALIFLDGMLGLELSADKKISLNPAFPKEWSFFSLKNVHIFNKNYTLDFEKSGKLWVLQFLQNGDVLFQAQFKLGERLDFRLADK